MQRVVSFGWTGRRIGPGCVPAGFFGDGRVGGVRVGVREEVRGPYVACSRRVSRRWPFRSVGITGRDYALGCGQAAAAVRPVRGAWWRGVQGEWGPEGPVEAGAGAVGGAVGEHSVSVRGGRDAADGRCRRRNRVHGRGSRRRVSSSSGWLVRCVFSVRRWWRASAPTTRRTPSGLGRVGASRSFGFRRRGRRLRR